MANPAKSLLMPAGRYILILIAAGGLAALGYLFLRDPARPGAYPPCIFHALTGGYCPGCGSLRCLHALLHGRIEQALAYNALTVLATPGLGLWFLNAGWREITGRPLFKPLPAWSIWCIAAILTAFWILRNIPVYPFTLLAPHQI